jgi:ribosomal protein S18 acetylase RimI-like enzyme
MKIKLYKRPGKKKALINELRSIIYKLTPDWFTKEVGEIFYIDLHYQDLFVIYEKNKIKSFIMFTCLDSYIHITLFATNSEDRNKGYGRTLYNYFEKYCIKKGFQKFSVMAKSPDKNELFQSTIEFYKKLDFKIIKIYTELWENGTVLMEKII